MKQAWFGLLLMSLAAGCAAPADRLALNYPLHDPLVNGRLVTVEIVSINGSSAPEQPMTDAIAGFAKYVAGDTRVITGDPVTLDADDDARITSEQITSLVAERGPCGASHVTIFLTPGISDAKLCGYCKRRPGGSHTVVIDTGRIAARVPLTVSTSKWWELVVKHELLHALSVPSDRRRNWSRRHCTQPACILYPRVDARSILAGMVNFGPPMDLCIRCQDEIDTAHHAAEAAGGKLVDPAAPYAHMTEFDLQVKLNPKIAQVYSNRAREYEKKKMFDKSIADHTRAIEVDKGHYTCYLNRAAAFKRQDKPASASADLDRIGQLYKDNAPVLNNTAWILATNRHECVRDADHAVSLAARACELTNWKAYYALSTLAAAYAESGDFEKAVQYQQKSIACIPIHIEILMSLKAVEKKRLELYRKDKPYRTSK